MSLKEKKNDSNKTRQLGYIEKSTIKSFLFEWNIEKLISMVGKSSEKNKRYYAFVSNKRYHRLNF